MRGSNNKSVTANKASVSITSTLYDRRALDCTEDKPLVNSLNHLTFLASSSVKVREALAQDGGLERLVDILYECQNPTNERERCIFAWKWVLAFQCLVLVGTRGSEKLRKRLVQAGMIPIIATILDNYIISKKTTLAATFGSGPRVNLPRETAVAANTTTTNNTVITRQETILSDSAADQPTDTAQTTTTTTNIGVPDHSNQEAAFNNESIQRILATQSTNNNGSSQTPSPAAARNVRQIVVDEGEIMNDQINEVFQNVRRLVAEADQTILEASTEIALHEQSEQRKKFISMPNSNDVSPGAVDEEYTKILKSLTFLKFLDRLNTTDNLQNINRELLTEFRDLTKSPVFADLLVSNQEISNILSEFLPVTDLPFFKKTEEKLNQSVPRDFENGILIPKEDDLIWSLQVLAFISKYTAQRYELSDTYIVNGLSLRNNNIPPPLEKDTEMNDNVDMMNDDDEVGYLESSASDMYDFLLVSDEESSSNDDNNQINSDNNHVEMFKNNGHPVVMQVSDSDFGTASKKQKFIKRKSDNSKYSYLLDNYCDLLNENDRIIKATKLEKFALDISRYSHIEHNNLRLRNNKFYKDKRSNYSKKWDYDSWDDFEMGPLSLLHPQSQNIDNKIKPIKRLNIFPLVEKFTVKHLHNKDITYWAALVARNSNRKDETKGGKRQCAYFGCGKWEDKPRQFAKCRRCKRAKYCSKECQSKAWTYHKYWCNAATTSTTATTTTNTSGSVAAGAAPGTASTNVESEVSSSTGVTATETESVNTGAGTGPFNTVSLLTGVANENNNNINNDAVAENMDVGTTQQQQGLNDIFNQITGGEM